MTSAASPRWRLWVPLLCGAGALALFGNKTPDAAIVSLPPTPVAHQMSHREIVSPSTATSAVTGLERSAPEPPNVQPLDRALLLPHAPTSKPTRDLFEAVSWLPALAPALPVALSVADTVPALPVLTVLGKKHDEAQVWEVYLARGDQTLIAREGTSLDGGLRVDSISPPTMNLTVTSTGQTFLLDIGAAR